MTERRGDGGFSVTARSVASADGQRTSPRRPRRPRRLGVAIVVLAGIALIAAGWLGPRLTSRPRLDTSYFATPTPSSSPSPNPSPSRSLRPGQTPAATPLPRMTLPDGSPPSGRLAMLGDRIRVLDLRTGDVIDGPQMSLGSDAVMTDPTGDGWICLCFTQEDEPGRSTRTVHLVRLDATGSTTTDQVLAAYPSTTNVTFGQPTVLFDADVRPGGTTAILATAARSGSSFRLAVRTINLAQGRIEPPIDLGSVALADPKPTPRPSPTPAPSDLEGGIPPPEFQPDEVYFDGPHLRVAPNGRSALVWGVIHRSNETGEETATKATLLEIDEDGGAASAVEVGALDGIQSYCPFIAYAAADRLASVCPTFEGSGDRITWVVQAIGLDGRLLGKAEVQTSNESFIAEPLFDRANGRVYLWDPGELTLDRIDIHALSVERVTFDSAATGSEGVSANGGAGPAAWHDADSAVEVQLFGQLAGSLDGERLYAIGIKRATVDGNLNQGSYGVFVIDRATLALIDRWAPAADDLAVATLPDGRVVTSGLPGFDADGRPVPWSGSITVHDPSDGRILARYGRISLDSPPAVVDR